VDVARCYRACQGTPRQERRGLRWSG
jgi:hypothetical protein